MKSVLEVNADNWEREVLQSSILVVVDFWHHRCPWCKMLDPIYDEVSEEYEGKIKFAKLNVLESHENQHIAIKYGVMGTPTLVFFCEGRPIQGMVGFIPKERLKKMLDDLVDKYRECAEKSTRL